VGKKSRITKQKELLDTEINSFTSFFTAKELFAKAKGKIHEIGIATIYRFLNERVKKHMLHSCFCNRTLVYSKNETNHAQFICEKCKKVVQFAIDDVSFVRKKIKGNICHVHVNVSGICDNCLAREAD